MVFIVDLLLSEMEKAAENGHLDNLKEVHIHVIMIYYMYII